MSIAGRIQKATTREAALQDALVQQFESELRDVHRRITRLVRQLLAEWDVDDQDRLISASANLGRAIGFRNQVRQLLERAGFTDLAVRASDAPLAKLTAMVLETSKIANTAAAMTPSALQMVEAFKELRLADLLKLRDDLARDLSRAVFDGVLGLRPVDRLVLDVSDRLEVSARQARTIYDTAVSTYSRQVDQLQATGDKDEAFIYVGPVDDVIREFCAEWVGKVLTRDEIDDLDNGQLPDVFLTGGGYNCRHAWKRVSRLDDELLELKGTDKRAPEVEAQLKKAA